ncbi:helix-turn-helix transcriptional regulator [Streptomyces sp. NPDC002640]
MRAARVHANLTREHVYLSAGISRWALQEAESGHGNPRLSTLLPIARVLRSPAPTAAVAPPSLVERQAALRGCVLGGRPQS